MKQTWFTDLVVNIWFYCSNMYPMALILFPPLSKPSWSASFPQDFAPFRWLLIPNPIKELHEQQWFWSLLKIPILTLERSLRSLKALNPSLLQLCCKEELLPINFWRVVWNTGAIQFCIFSELVDICCLRPVVYLHLLIPYSFVSL